MTTDFDKWYDDRFGKLLEDKEENRAAILPLYNSVVDAVARKFDHYTHRLPVPEVVETIKSMKGKSK